MQLWLVHLWNRLQPFLFLPVNQTVKLILKTSICFVFFCNCVSDIMDLHSFLALWLMYLICIKVVVTDNDDWVDPSDMINYDPVTKTMRNRQVPVEVWFVFSFPVQTLSLYMM